MNTRNPYHDNYTTDELVGLYYELLKNIYTGLLTEAMFNEIEMIEKAAEKRNMSLSYIARNMYSDESLKVFVIIQ
ncbi:hypothetical protein [Halobacillus sp. Marseille-P3879]|uniref:hypothetical protein n=1 Tax=Halobacillus TaxID=45667 RepID=UPI000C7B299E|nr:hypothetical protein [Halobacillus sp. Marseille-P3879]